jgi:hypothetical protein
MLNEDIFMKKLKFKLLIRNNPVINNIRRGMQQAIKYKVLKKSYQIILNDLV